MAAETRPIKDVTWFVSPDANDFSSRMFRTMLPALQLAARVGYLRFKPFDGWVDPRLIAMVEALVIGLVLYRVVTIVHRMQLVELSGGARGLAAVRQVMTTFSSHRQSTGLGMLVVVLLTAPVEVLLFELLVPWAAVRWLLLIATVYSVIWFAGFALAPVAHPHGLSAGLPERWRHDECGTAGC